MGVIFRNGRPYGAQEKDVTTVATVADLADLASKKENHIYIVEEDNIPYRYDKATRQFYPLSSSGGGGEITAEENQLIVGDGEDWAKGNVNGYYTVFSQDSINLLGTTVNSAGGAAFGNISKQNNQYSLTGGFRTRGTALLDMSDNSKIYTSSNSRLAIHDGAWLDVTGEDTQVKFNSGSKVYIDSNFGKNNLAIHGAWIMINDSKSYAYSKPKYYATMRKGEYEEPPTDYDIIKDLVYLNSVELNKSTHYTYAEGEESALNACRSCNSVEELNYNFDSLFYDGTQTISGIIFYKYYITFIKQDESITETAISSYSAHGYESGVWPSESQNVPRINISGAPHIQISDKTNIDISLGAALHLSDATAQMGNGSILDIQNSYMVLQSNDNSSYPSYPFFVIDNTYGASVFNKSITLGYTPTSPRQNFTNRTNMIPSWMMSKGNGYTNDITGMSWTGDNGKIKPTLSNSVTYEWLTNSPVYNSNIKVYDGKRSDLLPFIRFGNNTYFKVDNTYGNYYYEADIKDGAFQGYTSNIKPYAQYLVSPTLETYANVRIKFGGLSYSESLIQHMLGQSAKFWYLNDSAQESKQVINIGIGKNAESYLHIGSLDNSKIEFDIFGGQGKTHINGLTKSDITSGKIKVLLSGVDVFIQKQHYVHSEMHDYSRFIMRGDNTMYNNPGTWYTVDATQKDGADNNFSEYHLNQNWDRPINNEDVDVSPTFQMYDNSNLIIRGWWNYPTKTVTIQTTAYSSLTENTEISLTDLKALPTEWNAFLSDFTNNNQEFIGLVPESTIIANATQIKVNNARYQFTGTNDYKKKKYHPNAGFTTGNKRSSIVEVTDNSELRLWDGICIYARYNPETNEPGIEIVNRYNKNGTDGSGAAGELDRVEFTFAELKALKILIDGSSSNLPDASETQF